MTGHLAAPEHWEYSDIARNLLRGGGAFHEYLGTPYFLYGSWLYPRLLAAVLRVTHGHEAAMVVLQASFAAATSVTVLLITRHLLRSGIETVGAVLLTALHPGSLVYIGKLHPQTLDACLVTLSFLLLVKLIRTPTMCSAVVAGLVSGLAAISRGTIVPFYVLWAGWFLVVWRGKALRAATVLACTAVAGTAIVAPVLLDGYLRYGRIVPLRSDTGINLWLGNHEGASGTSYTLDAGSVPLLARMPSELKGRLLGRNEIEQNDLLTSEVAAFVRTHPGSFARLFSKKLWYFWWRSPHTGLLYPRWWATMYTPYYLVIALAALVGLLCSFRSPTLAARQAATAFVLLATTFSVTQALFYVEGRHRWQIEPLLLVYAVIGLKEGYRMARRPTGRQEARSYRADSTRDGTACAC